MRPFHWFRISCHGSVQSMLRGGPTTDRRKRHCIDARRLQVVANGLPSFHGAQVAVDVTLVSPIQRDPCPRPGAEAEPGLAIAQAEERKRRTYPEFGHQARCRLVVLALEVRGRWSTATQTFLRDLARGRALASPVQSRAALAHALQRRWGQMLAIAANTALSSSLLELPATAVPGGGPCGRPLDLASPLLSVSLCQLYKHMFQIRREVY